MKRDIGAAGVAKVEDDAGIAHPRSIVEISGDQPAYVFSEGYALSSCSLFGVAQLFGREADLGACHHYGYIIMAPRIEGSGYVTNSKPADFAPERSGLGPNASIGPSAPFPSMPMVAARIAAQARKTPLNSYGLPPVSVTVRSSWF